MKTKIIVSIISFISMFTLSFAADIASIVVQVDPATIKVWEPADVTIKAIDENWDTVMDYEWDVIMSLVDKDGNEVQENDYVLPNGGDYSFTEEDQWEKKFTKWFTVNKAWDYKLIVEDFDTEQSWEWEVKVINKEWWNEKWEVTITTPQNWETIVDSIVTVIWTAVKYRNSKIQVLLDGNVEEEWQIDSSWNYQVDLQSISNGKHTLKVNVLDINDEIVSSSKEVNINVTVKSELLKKLDILPSDEVAQGTKVELKATVSPQVNSVVAHIVWYGDYPMDRMNTDTFTMQFVANKPWKFDIWLTVAWEFGDKKYDNYKKLVVIEKIAIQNVRFVRDNPKKTIDLTWEFTGQVPAFKVLYGTEKEKLDMSAIVKENKYTINNIDEAKTYFVKIIPTDSNWDKIWDESKLLVIEPNMKKAATCTIDNIKVNTVIEWWKHYLVWKRAEWALEYAIYKGEDKANLIKITTTTWTIYEVPFNKNAKKTEYAYFAVKAVCDDGAEKQIDKVKKVKVGPMDWLIYALIVAMMIYGIKLTYRTN